MKNETLTQTIQRRLKDFVGHHARIASESGVPQTTLSRIYTGTSSPTVRTIEPLMAWFRKHDAAEARKAAKKSKSTKTRH